MVLVERPSELIGRDELTARAWPNIFVEDRKLKVQVAVRIEILPAVRNANLLVGETNTCYLWRPSSGQWELGCAGRHKSLRPHVES